MLKVSYNIFDIIYLCFVFKVSKEFHIIFLIILDILESNKNKS